MMRNGLQIALVVVSSLALVAVLGLLAQITLAPVVHGGPARTIAVQAGPYPLTLTLYAYPIQAGYALPFAVKSTTEPSGSLSYAMTANPGRHVSASVVQGDINTGSQTADGTPGSIYITVQGPWTLHLQVTGPAGSGAADVPITANAPLVIPPWLAWTIGFIPCIGLGVFIVVVARRVPRRVQVTSQQA